MMVLIIRGSSLFRLSWKDAKFMSWYANVGTPALCVSSARVTTASQRARAVLRRIERAASLQWS